MQQPTIQQSAIDTLTSICKKVRVELLSLNMIVAATLVVASVSMASAQPMTRATEGLSSQSPETIEETLTAIDHFETEAVNERPEFNGVWVCGSSFLLIGFDDPDGDDSQINVLMTAFNMQGPVASRWMHMQDYHGVYFWDIKVPGAVIYQFRAFDSFGSVSQVVQFYSCHL